MKVYNVKVLSSADGYNYSQMVTSFSSLVKGICKINDSKFYKHIVVLNEDNEQIGTIFGAKYGNNVPLNIDVICVDINFIDPIDIEEYDIHCNGHIVGDIKFFRITYVVLTKKCQIIEHIM